MNTRRSRVFSAFGLVALLIGSLAIFLVRPPGAADADPFPSSRDVMRWPFAWNSIWNLPVGDQARLVPAGLPASRGMGLGVDENVIILEPQARQTNIARNSAGWSWQSTRCGSVDPGSVVASNVPIPADFSTDPGYLGVTPNMAGAVLMADGATVLQTQPFHVCGAGGVATSEWVYPSDNLHTGDGIRGAHGGSGMSSVGGAVRVGELVPGGAIRHALKLEIDCGRLCYYNGGEADGAPGYRWPANKADGDAAGRYRGPNPAVQMGSLLVLPPNFDESQLQTEPARILARALRDYGGYIVDDTGWDTHAIATEWSPDGRVIDEFSSAWGFDMETSQTAGCGDGSASCQWANDIATMFTTLHVVDDNSPTTVGGSGARLAPCAPAFADGSGGAPAGCGPATPRVADGVSTPPVPVTEAPAPAPETTEPQPPAAEEPPTTEAPAVTEPPSTEATQPAPETTEAPTTQPPTTQPPATTTTVADSDDDDLDDGEVVEEAAPTTSLVPKERPDRVRRHLERLFQFWLQRHWRFQPLRG